VYGGADATRAGGLRVLVGRQVLRPGGQQQDWRRQKTRIRLPDRGLERPTTLPVVLIIGGPAVFCIPLPIRAPVLY
jgi:hypothetical protein